MKKSVRKVRFGKLSAIELKTSELRLVAVTSRGPRIAFLGRAGGPNLLYWAPGKHKAGDWDLGGGHRLWTTRPGADEGQETYRPDNEPCSVETTADGFTIEAPVDPETRLQRGIRVRAVATDRVEIEHSATNTGDMLWSGGLWALTCTVPTPESTYVAPLGDGSPWDYATIVAFNTWGGGHGGGGFADPQFDCTRDQFLLRPAGRENKRMLKADAGILALHDPTREVLFAKQARFCDGADYPLGTNLALYVGPENFMVEMETMGPAQTLKPGQTVRHTETWVVRPSGRRTPTNAALRKLFSA